MIDIEKRIYFWDFWGYNYDFWHKILLEIFDDRISHVAGWSVDEFLEWAQTDVVGDLSEIKVFAGPYYNTLTYLLEDTESYVNMTALTLPHDFFIYYFKKLKRAGYQGSLYQWVSSLDWEDRFSNYQSRSLFVEGDPRIISPSSPELTPNSKQNILQANLEVQREFVRFPQKQLFRRAVELLNNSFFFVGIEELRELSYKHLCEKLEVEEKPLSKNYPSDDNTDLGSHYPDALEIIEKTNAVDYELHAYFSVRITEEKVIS